MDLWFKYLNQIRIWTVFDPLIALVANYSSENFSQFNGKYFSFSRIASPSPRNVWYVDALDNEFHLPSATKCELAPSISS